MKRAALEVQEASKPVNVYFGEVVSVKPLKINVEQKMVLGEGQLILTRNVTDYMTTVTVQWETAGPYPIISQRVFDFQITGFPVIQLQ